MNFAMDERLKQRVIGIAVIISLIAIFAPVILKKSSQHFDDKNMVSIQLPTQPQMARINPPSEQQLFNQIKLAKIEAPVIPEHKATSPITQAHTLSKNVNQFNAKPLAAVQQPTYAAAPAKTITVAAIKPTVVAANSYSITNNSHSIKRIGNKAVRSGYAVQIAMFIERNNAVALVQKLKGKGYSDASFIKVKNKGRNSYKVYVGKTIQKQQALKVKNQLASALQIKGFLVPTEIS